MISSALLMMALAAEPESWSIEATRPQLEQIAGVYKDRFKNGTIDGYTYTSENILEVVKTSENTAYFRIHTEFFNGHECNLQGIARLERDALTYRGPVSLDGTPCVLKIKANREGLVFNDVNAVCNKQTCGSRGGYGYGNGVNSTFVTRRPIRYMKRLLASDEYAQAVAEFNSGKAQP